MNKDIKDALGQYWAHCFNEMEAVEAIANSFGTELSIDEVHRAYQQFENELIEHELAHP